MWRVSSSQVGLVVGKKPNPWMTHPVADLALEVAGGWWTRFTRIPFRLQFLNTSYYCWVARGSPISSVSRKCFQFGRCNVALTQCGLYTVFVSLVLPTRMPKAMIEMSIEDLLKNPRILHTNDMSAPSELCSLQKCLYSTDVTGFEYSGVQYTFLPLDVCYFSETPQTLL